MQVFRAQRYGDLDFGLTLTDRAQTLPGCLRVSAALEVLPMRCLRWPSLRVAQAIYSPWQRYARAVPANGLTRINISDKWRCSSLFMIQEVRGWALRAGSSAR